MCTYIPGSWLWMSLFQWYMYPWELNFKLRFSDGSGFSSNGVHVCPFYDNTLWKVIYIKQLPSVPLGNDCPYSYYLTCNIDSAQQNILYSPLFKRFLKLSRNIQPIFSVITSTQWKQKRANKWEYSIDHIHVYCF